MALYIAIRVETCTFDLSFLIFIYINNNNNINVILYWLSAAILYVSLELHISIYQCIGHITICRRVAFRSFEIIAMECSNWICWNLSGIFSFKSNLEVCIWRILKFNIDNQLWPNDSVVIRPKDLDAKFSKIDFIINPSLISIPWYFSFCSKSKTIAKFSHCCYTTIFHESLVVCSFSRIFLFNSITLI